MEQTCHLKEWISITTKPSRRMGQAVSKHYQVTKQPLNYKFRPCDCKNSATLAPGLAKLNCSQFELLATIPAPCIRNGQTIKAGSIGTQLLFCQCSQCFAGSRFQTSQVRRPRGRRQRARHACFFMVLGHG